MGKRVKRPGVNVGGTSKNDKYSNNFHKLIKSIIAVSCDHYHLEWLRTEIKT